MRRDFERLKSKPLSSDAAFNFFVTAEHMLDWVYPKRINKEKRTNARKKSVVLQVCSHLANGAKHFELEGRHHNSVSSTGAGVGWSREGFFAPDYFADGYFEERLVVSLKGDAAKELGQSIGAIELAEKVIAYWDKHPLA